MGANAQTTVPTFTAGQVLTADQQNQSARTGVPVFSTTGTRDAGFGGTGEKTLAEGQLCYVEGTGLQSYNGTSWVTWGTAPSTGALVVVKSETAFSASSSVTADTVFTSTYTNYLLIVTATSSTTHTVRMRLRTSGSSNTTANYNFTDLRVQSTGVFGGLSSGQTAFNLNEGGQTNPFSTVMYIYSPQTATRTQFTSHSWNNNASATAYQTALNSGNFAADTQFDGVEIYPSTGTITGSYTIYGLAKS